MAQKITEEELLTRIKGEITDALGYSDTLSVQREKAMEYYYALPFGNEVEGRSQFVDSTVTMYLPKTTRVGKYYILGLLMR